MKNTKLGWKEKNTFESYYYKQLQKLKSVIYTEHWDFSINENSSLEEISKRFDEAIENIILHKEENKAIKEPFPLRKIDPSRVNIENKILVVNVDSILIEYKDQSSDEIKNMLEAKYGCKVFLIDTSRKNTQGTSINNLPVYFA
jgi:hypothetical protein